MKRTCVSSPHIRDSVKASRLMLDVGIALLPALGVGVWKLGAGALAVAVVSVAAAMAAEWLWCRLMGQRNTLPDCSAAVTGLLLALTLPVTCPLWAAAAASVFAVLCVKLMCGGLGQNILNPALTARALLVWALPVAVTRYAAADGVSVATPLHHMVRPGLPEESVLDMFLGNCAGSIGELSALALLIGGGYLVLRKVISIRIPGAYLGTVAVLTLMFHRTDSAWEWMAYSLFSGGLMLGAIFMATDYATSPVTPLGQVLYGIGCGVLTVVFRYTGLFPEGVTYAILLMNLLTWTLDRWTAPRRFGVKKGATA